MIFVSQPPNKRMQLTKGGKTASTSALGLVFSNERVMSK